MNLFKKVDEMRIKRGWSFYKLSQESGLTQQTFTKWMEGKTTPTLPALQAVCNAFGITLANFFAEGNLIEVTPDTKLIFDNWHHLTLEEKSSIISIIDNYIKRKEN